jgi:hypothetical protein
MKKTKTQQDERVKKLGVRREVVRQLGRRELETVHGAHGTSSSWPTLPLEGQC